MDNTEVLAPGLQTKEASCTRTTLSHTHGATINLLVKEDARRRIAPGRDIN